MGLQNRRVENLFPGKPPVMAARIAGELFQSQTPRGAQHDKGRSLCVAVMIGGHNNLPSFDHYDTVSAGDLKEAAGRFQACLPTGAITGAEAL